jgi:hypothetical protein
MVDRHRRCRAAIVHCVDYFLRFQSSNQESLKHDRGRLMRAEINTRQR